MKKSRKYFFLILACTVTFAFCDRKCPCEKADAPFQLISFQKNEIDTVIIRRFIKGTGFQSLKDTLIADSTNTFYEKTGGDTVQIVTDPKGHVVSDFDFEIYIPSVNRLTKISAITEQFNEGLCGHCVNFIQSYSINGTEVTAHFINITK